MNAKKFFLRVVSEHCFVVELDSRAAAIALAQQLERGYNVASVPKEKRTTVRVIDFGDHCATCDQCGLSQEPCEVGKQIVDGHAEQGALLFENNWVVRDKADAVIGYVYAVTLEEALESAREAWPNAEISEHQVRKE